MMQAAIMAAQQWVLVVFGAFRALFSGSWVQFPRRLLVLLFGLPLLIGLQLIHWIGFACDELFFRRYRRVSVRRPLFITGIPRSGTTHLQRVLARHDRLSSMQTWECLLAPSITERYVFRWLGRVFKPLSSLFRRVPFLKTMASIHEFGLTEAEEDFVALLPVNACFLLVVLMPEAKHYWRLADFDRSMPARQKTTILGFYHRLVQRHLWFHGEHLTYLCKNPSFMSWPDSLKATFPDASFVFCERPAEKTVPSQLSSLKPGWEMVQGGDLSKAFSERIVRMLAAYYHRLEALDLTRIHGMRLPMRRLVKDLESSVHQVMTHADIAMTEAFRSALDEEVRLSKQYRSQHRYEQQQNLSWARLRRHFPQAALTSMSEKGA
ncbi:sulfotransferase [Reinekea blandensis]|uniref:Sulfotransferase n=1 Tax=Reinekea blandensis MED297 TaxID=314283 RepID=A4BGT5_9GAMM|nr:sulfotransferase [Reinekea blandensis]EAR08733.1 hypothetical protein MED297_14495 [Reinekea sp. MED297] [Reinekea blandensis MED297]